MASHIRWKEVRLTTAVQCLRRSLLMLSICLSMELLAAPTSMPPETVRIYYKKNHLRISEEERPKLDAWIDQVRQHRGGNVFVAAYSDGDGRPGVIKAVSERRGGFVADYIRELLAGTPSKVIVEVHGAKFASAVTSEGKAKERRVEISYASSTMNIASAPPSEVVSAAPPADVIRATPRPLQRNRATRGLLIEGSLSFSPSAPASFRRPVYAGSSAALTSVAPYEYRDRAADAAFVPGGQVALTMETTHGFAYSFGARYRAPPTFATNLTFDPQIGDYGYGSTLEATTFGAFAEAMPINVALGESMTARAGLGIDVDMSTVTFTEAVIDGRAATSVEKLGSFESTLVVLAMRASSGVFYHWGDLAVGGQLMMQMPLTEIARSFVADEALSEFSQDLQHQPTMGGEMAITAYYRL